MNWDLAPEPSKKYRFPRLIGGPKIGDILVPALEDLDQGQHPRSVNGFRSGWAPACAAKIPERQPAVLQDATET